MNHLTGSPVVNERILPAHRIHAKVALGALLQVPRWLGRRVADRDHMRIPWPRGVTRMDVARSTASCSKAGPSVPSRSERLAGAITGA